MTVTANPIGAAAPLPNGPANSPAKSPSPSSSVADTVQLSIAGQAAVLSPQEAVLDETDTYVELVKAAANGDAQATILLNALASIPPPEIP